MPHDFILPKTASGGGAPAVIILISWVKSILLLIKWSAIICIIIGAPLKWDTLCLIKAFTINSPAGCLRHTCVPALSVTVQGKHQPLQWNIGSVHKYLGNIGISQTSVFPIAFKYAPLWWYTTPLGLPVVPDV